MIAECLFAWGATQQQQQQQQGQAQGQALPRALSARCGQPRSPRSYKYSNSFAQIAASRTNRAFAHHLLMHCNTDAARAKGITSRLRPCCVDRGVVVRGAWVCRLCLQITAGKANHCCGQSSADPDRRAARQTDRKIRWPNPRVRPLSSSHRVRSASLALRCSCLHYAIGYHPPAGCA